MSGPDHAKVPPGEEGSTPALRPLRGSFDETPAAPATESLDDLHNMNPDDLDDELPATNTGDLLRQAMRSCAAMELRTFVVPDGVLSTQSSLEQRLQFLDVRLAHRLPCPVSQVRRVDLFLFEPGALLLRVWCAVD